LRGVKVEVPRIRARRRERELRLVDDPEISASLTVDLGPDRLRLPEGDLRTRRGLGARGRAREGPKKLTPAVLRELKKCWTRKFNEWKRRDESPRVW